jgi:membrane protease YdiL (CAAX protease family)
MAQEDWMMGFTLAAKALLVTVLQSTVVPPPPVVPFLLQDMLIKTKKMIMDVIIIVILMPEIFWRDFILSHVKKRKKFKKVALIHQLFHFVFTVIMTTATKNCLMDIFPVI